MARRLREAATDAHFPALDSMTSMVYRWERTHLSSERYQLWYARALGIHPDLLAAGPTPSPVSSPSLASDGGDGDDLVNRREFGVTTMGVLAGSLIPPPRVPALVSAEHVRTLRDSA